MDLQDFHSNPEVSAAIAKAVEDSLKQIGEDPQREGLLKTPHRVGEALQFLCKGYNEDAEAILRSALFEEDYLTTCQLSSPVSKPIYAHFRYDGFNGE